MSQRVNAKKPEDNAHFENCVAVGPENGQINGDLRSIINAPPELPEAVRTGVVAMVRPAKCSKRD